MNSDFERSTKIFDLLLEADRNIWAAVLEIRDGEVEELKKLVQPLMKLRGALHVEGMRPIYTRYPELAKIAGLDEGDS